MNYGTNEIYANNESLVVESDFTVVRPTITVRYVWTERDWIPSPISEFSLKY